MYKKALSLLLALMLIVTSLSVAIISVAATEDGDSAGVTVKATSNLFATKEQSFSQEDLAAKDNLVTVTYFIQSAEGMVNCDWELTYDSSVLQFDEANNQADGKLNVMPCASDAMVNTNAGEGIIVGNCTNLTPYDLTDANGDRTAFVTATFKVIGSGDTTVILNVKDLKVTSAKGEASTTDKETQLVDNGVVASDAPEYTAQTEVYGGIYDDDYVEPTTTEPVETTTEPQETTTEPQSTTEPVVEDTFVVAGTPADIFGTAWDGTNEDNKMTANEDGTFTRDYTVDKAFDVVQLKAVKNGADWFGNETGNNVTFAITDAGTFTVTATPTEDGYVVSVSGDNVADVHFEVGTVFAVGNGEGAWLNGAAWDPASASNEMTEVAEGVWEIEFANVPDGFERQIKFAIDGAWTHNFGAPKEDVPEFESGVTFDATYDGGNITFDTDDVCTVKAQLDLREFDFLSKAGAKFTITINYDEPVPTTTEPTTEPAPVGNGLTVVATSNFFPETKAYYDDVNKYADEDGNVFITVDYKMAADGKYLINLDVDELTWDPAVLEFKEAYNKVKIGRAAQFTIFPFAMEQGLGAGMVNTFGDENGGRIVGNYTSVSPAAYAYYEEDGSPITVVRAVFKLLDKDAKLTTVNLSMDTLSLCDDSVAEPYSQYTPISGGVIDDEAYALGTYNTIFTPTGEEPPVPTTTEPEPTTTEPEPAKNLTVTGSSNYCASVDAQTVKVGDSVTVTFKAPETRNIVDIQWGMDYDKDKLELTGISTFDKGAMLINTNAESYNVMGSLTDIENPYAVTEGDDFITFVFNATADGETDVKLTIIDMTVREDDGDVIIFENTVDKRTPVPTTTVPETTAPETTAPETTAPETTAPETTAPETTAPETTAPETTAPETTAPETTAPATSQPGTASTDVTSATGTVTTNPATGDSSPDNPGGGGGNGAVQTGGASMALIILLVLVSATAGIYFARKRVK